MTCTQAILSDLGWRQPDLARFLGVAQATVSRYFYSEPDGPAARMLALLRAGIDAGRVTRGMDHRAALDALGVPEAIPDTRAAV